MQQRKRQRRVVRGSPMTETSSRTWEDASGNCMATQNDESREDAVPTVRRGELRQKPDSCVAERRRRFARRSARIRADREEDHGTQPVRVISCTIMKSTGDRSAHGRHVAE